MELFCSLPNKGLQPDVWTYNIMIKGLCKERLTNEACILLEQIDGNCCPPNDVTYNTIIKGLLQNNETSKAMKYLQMMVGKGFLTDATIAAMCVDMLSADKIEKNV
ncbi:hypothetical protein CJ030_MR5G003184 [Morella rubra]|uniref:Pentatricopeptide repeat-containing protein n=1 Tax=Morella rubra TaxID=262757 RepID=A0A6A1VP64_9ROSI|nr:hypothetical protein CJ030_MR5G003184 [Morella rubra]